MNALVDVVIPVYNEDKNIGEALSKIASQLTVPYTLSLVYDRDDDTTLAPATAKAKELGLQLHLVKNRYGRGALNAIKTGLTHGDAPFVVITMADLSDPPQVINQMVELAEARDLDVVCASRYMKGGRQIGGPWLKKMMSRAAGVSLYYAAGLPTHDVTNSFKLYRRRIFEKIEIESSGGFELGMEIVVKARALGYRIGEVPTTWIDRTGGESRFRLWAWLPHYLHWYFFALRHRPDEPLSCKRSWMLFLTLLVLLALEFVPLTPFLPAAQLDASWILGLNQALNQGLAFGRDVLFTMGPYASVYSRGYLPATDSFFLVIGFYLAVCYAFLLRLLCPDRVVVPLLFALSLLLFRPPMDAQFFLYPLLLTVWLLTTKARPSSWRVVALVSPLGLIPFIKGSFLLASGAAVVLGALGGFALPVIASFLVSHVFFWKLAGQPLGSLMGFDRSIFAFGKDYADALAYSGNDHDILRYWLTALFAFLAIGWSRSLSKRQRTLLLLSFASFFFLSAKASFVRHDSHAITAAGAVVYGVLALTVLRPPAIWWAAALSALLTFLPISHHYQIVSVSRVLQAVDDGWQRLCQKGFPDQDFAASLRGVRERLDLSELKGSTDIYPLEIVSVLAAGLSWSPRPVFQSYAAFNEELAKSNAQHLLSPRAPQNILFKPTAIDDVLPALSDGPSWPLFKCLYEPRSIKGEFVWLERKQQHAPCAEPQWQAPVSKRFDEEISLDPGASYVRLELRKSLRGRVDNFWLKAHPLLIEIKTAQGQTHVFKMIAPVAKAGFLLSPLLTSAEDWMDYHRGSVSNERRVVSFKISEETIGASDWDRQFSVSFARFE